MMMNRSRIALGASLIATGCAGIIGVPSLTFDENASTDGGIDGTTANDGNFTTTGNDANATCNTDVSLDARNCGRCGHSCGAGMCSGGLCQPYPLVDGVTLGQLAVDSTRLYYADNGNNAIKSVNKDGSTPPVDVVPGVAQPVGVGIEGTLLYWTSRVADPTDKSGLYRCALSAAGVCSDTKQVSSHYYSQNIAVQGTNVFFASQDGVFRSLPDAGEYAIKGATQNYFDVAAGTDFVYLASQASVIERGVADGGGPAVEDFVTIDSDSNFYYVAVDGDRVFYAVGDIANGGVVASVLQTNKAVATTYGSSTGYPVGIAADAQYVYWADRGTLVGTPSSAAKGDGHLYACPRGGCAGEPLVLATGLRGGGFITLDDGFVYFAENNNFGTNGRIRAVAKP